MSGEHTDKARIAAEQADIQTRKPERKQGRYVEIRTVELNSDFLIPDGTEVTAMCAIVAEPSIQLVILIQEHWR